MKTYSDKRIEFSYPEEFKLIRAKKKWGQYSIAKKWGLSPFKKKDNIVVFIDFIPQHAIGSVKTLIRDCPYDETAKGKYFEDVIFGEKKGFGNVVTCFDNSGKFIMKIYRYLFPLKTGGLNVEVTGMKEFSIDEYKELLESIKIKD